MPVVVGAIVALAILLLTNADRVTIIAVGIPLALWSMICVAVENKTQRDRLSAFANFIPVPYTKTLEYVLKLLASTMKPRTTEVVKRKYAMWQVTPSAKNADDRNKIIEMPWSWPVLDFSIRIAIIYPFTFALFQLALGGESASFGNTRIIPANEPLLIWGSLLVITCFGVGKVLMLLFPNERVFSRVTLFVVLVGAVSAYLGTTQAYVFVISFLIGFAIFLVGLHAFLLSLGLIATTTLAASHFIFDYFFTVCLSFAAVGSCYLVAHLTRKGAHWGLLGYCLLMIAVLLFTALLIEPSTTKPAMLTIVITLVMLPAVNAIFDWLSYGATIWLVSRGHSKGGVWPLLSGLADCLIALLLFAALGVTFVSIIGWIESATNLPVIQVGNMIENIRYEPNQNFWLIAMATSTLIPTFLHLCLGLISIMTWLRAEIWNWFVDRLDGERHFILTNVLSSAALTVLSLAYVAIPTYLIYLSSYFFWAYGGRVRVFYLDKLGDFATWAGFS